MATENVAVEGTEEGADAPKKGGKGLIIMIIAALVLGLRVTPGPDARMLIGIGVVGTFLLTRVIAQRLAMEFLPD